MKYIKIYENYNEYENDYGEIKSVILNGEYYHGTGFDGGDFFKYITVDYSDWEAVWVTDDVYIAQEFSEERETNDSVCDI